MSATEASKQALCRHARQRSDNVRKRIDKALTDLRRSGATLATQAPTGDAHYAAGALD